MRGGLSGPWFTIMEDAIFGVNILLAMFFSMMRRLISQMDLFKFSCMSGYCWWWRRSHVLCCCNLVSFHTCKLMVGMVMTHGLAWSSMSSSMSWFRLFSVFPRFCKYNFFVLSVCHTASIVCICIRPITTIFCTRHDSVTVVTCAKYRCGRSSIFKTREFWIFIKFRIRSKYA